MRKRVNWYKELIKLDDPDLFSQFFDLFKKLRHGKSMSINRCAYYVLKSYYSTTTIGQLCEKLGI